MKNIESIEGLKEFLKEFFEKETVEIYLFGSRARGNFRENSDIDIGILSKSDISYKLSELREIIENSNLPQTVDIVDLNENKKFLEIVKKEGIKWI